MSVDAGDRLNVGTLVHLFTVTHHKTTKHQTASHYYYCYCYRHRHHHYYYYAVDLKLKLINSYYIHQMDWLNSHNDKSTINIVLHYYYHSYYSMQLSS